MSIDPDDLIIAKQAVQEEMDKFVPGWAKSMVPANAAADLALAVLKALEAKKEGKII